MLQLSTGSRDRSKSGPLYKVMQLSDRDVVGEGFHSKITIGGEKDDFADKMTNFTCWWGKETEKLVCS